MESISITEAKNHLTSIIHQVETSHDVVEFTRHGKAAVVMLAAEDYIRLCGEQFSFSSLLTDFKSRFEGVEISDETFENIRSQDTGRNVDI